MVQQSHETDEISQKINRKENSCKGGGRQLWNLKCEPLFFIADMKSPEKYILVSSSIHIIHIADIAIMDNKKEGKYTWK